MNAIEKMIEKIANNRAGIVYTDAGSGCGGPGYANAETLKDMLKSGDFEDAVEIKFDEMLLKNTLRSARVFASKGTEWTQIEFSFGENGYRQIAWIWQE